MTKIITEMNTKYNNNNIIFIKYNVQCIIYKREKQKKIWINVKEQMCAENILKSEIFMYLFFDENSLTSEMWVKYWMFE